MVAAKKTIGSENLLTPTFNMGPKPEVKEQTLRSRTINGLTTARDAVTAASLANKKTIKELISLERIGCATESSGEGLC